MKGLSRHDVTLITTVQAHLRSLSSFSTHLADEATMRIATGTLRALISEGMLQRAWSLSGFRGPVTVRTYIILKLGGDDTVAYCGGGDVIPNVPFSVCRNAELQERVLALKDFERQKRIVVGSESASTIDIIKYVANALGGAHHNPTGQAARKYDLLRRIEAGLDGQIFISHVNNRNLLYHEIHSIVQAVLRSPQVGELLGWVEKK